MNMQLPFQCYAITFEFLQGTTCHLNFCKGPPAIFQSDNHTSMVRLLLSPGGGGGNQPALRAFSFHVFISRLCHTKTWKPEIKKGASLLSLLVIVTLNLESKRKFQENKGVFGFLVVSNVARKPSISVTWREEVGGATSCVNRKYIYTKCNTYS